MDVKQTYCGDHFAIHTNTESFHCIVETSIMSCQLNFNLKKKKKTPFGGISLY